MLTSGTKIVKLILGNLVVLIVLLGLVEIGLRVLGIGYGSNPHIRHPIYHHVNPPNYYFTVHDPIGEEFGGHSVYYNTEGRRINPQHIESQGKEKTIAFLGDSFVKAAEVPFQKSFFGILQKKLSNIEFINYGVSSYSPVLYYLQTKNIILKNQPLPDQAFILLYSNDVLDDSLYLNNAKYNDLGKLIAIDGGKSNIFVQVLRKSYLIRLMRRMQLKLKFILEKRKNQSNDNRVIGGYLEQVPSFTGSPSAIYTKKTIELLEDEGIETWLMVVPSKYAHYNKDFLGEELSEQVQEWAKKYQFNFINLHLPFEKSTLVLDEKLFYKVDVHFNEKGHQLVADIIRPYIIE